MSFIQTDRSEVGHHANMSLYASQPSISLFAFANMVGVGLYVKKPNSAGTEILFGCDVIQNSRSNSVICGQFKQLSTRADL